MLRRSFLAGTLMLSLSWFSLMYGWGVTVKRVWPVALYWFFICAIWPCLCGWVEKGRKYPTTPAQHASGQQRVADELGEVGQELKGVE
jgi:hypothetical protein